MKLLIVGLVALVSTTARADQLDGLYRPAASWAANWTCDANYLGEDGGALGLFKKVLYGVESQCELGPSRSSMSGSGLVYHASCSAEAEVTHTDIQISQTRIGIDITRDGQTMHWQRCDSPTASRPTPTNIPWVAGFGMGVEEAWTEDKDGNRIIFSCSGGQDGRISVDLYGRPVPGGDIKFDVDGASFEMTVRAQGGDIFTDCNACADNYRALREAVARGRVMLVRSGDLVAQFGLSGSRKALGAEPCEPAGGDG